MIIIRGKYKKSYTQKRQNNTLMEIYMYQMIQMLLNYRKEEKMNYVR